MRPDTTVEALAKLPTAFSKDGTVTAGNASGIVDGGAAVMLAPKRARRRAACRRSRGLPAGRPSASTRASWDGPAPAIRKLLEKTKLSLDDIDLFEINEAFRGAVPRRRERLGLDREKVNVNGGAIALGHPLGATGARILLTLTLEMRRRGAKRGIAAACIGGGQGIAALVETL
jgi:acetyl-CoA acetyltransferase family protein